MTTAPTRGLEGFLIETHNWGKTVAFWQALGYVLEFETDHHSGQLRHPAGGPYLFIAEVPGDHAPELQPMIALEDADRFTPPPSAVVEHGFEPQHWGALEMMLRDPDGRHVSVQAPLPTSRPVG
jgi:hypothetical protein